MTTKEQIKMARAGLGWGVRDLAEKAGVTANTISRIENGADALGTTSRKIEAALEAAGIIFIAENGEGPGVRLRKGTGTE
jgi:transcriptional regulator with XRE-family HTH domain